MSVDGENESLFIFTELKIVRKFTYNNFENEIQSIAAHRLSFDIQLAKLQQGKRKKQRAFGF